MKKIFTLSTAIIFQLNSFSQSPDWLWAKAIGGLNWDVAYGIATDPAGNVYTTGSFRATVDFDPGAAIFNLTSAGTQDIFISKLDGSGNFVWAKAMGAMGTAGGFSICIDASGNIYTAGFFSGTVDFDPDAGIFNLTSAGLNDIFISKLDSTGHFVWAKRIGGTSEDYCNSIAVDLASGGDIYTTGHFGGTVDFDPGAGVFNLVSAVSIANFICKLDSSGNFVWAKTMGEYVRGNSIALDPAGSCDVYTTGQFNGTVDFDPGAGIFNLTAAGSNEIFISKLDSAGNFIWAKSMGGIDNDKGESITVDPMSGGYVYITGQFTGTSDFDPGAGVFNLISNGVYDVFISKLDGLGNFVWAKAMGGIYNDNCTSIAVDAAGSGDVYIVGSFAGTVDFDPGTGIFILTSAGGNYDVFISRLDASGNFDWAIAEGGTYNDYGRSVAINPLGYVSVTGFFSSASVSFGPYSLTNADSTSSDPDVFIAKLDTAMAIGINDVLTSLNMTSVFPNPATTQLTIQSSEFKVESVEVFDVMGSRVIALPLNPLKGTSASTVIDVSSLSSGIYFVKVRGEKVERVAKFVKQ